MRTPALNSLRMFDAAARRLNFRAAGEELNLTQGAVAQQVRRLEEDLDIQLFERQARGLTLTEAGSAYHDSVRRALLIIDQATDQLRPDTNNIKISVTPTIASKWLLPKLSELRELHPDLNVEIDSSTALANFRTDGVDLAIRQGPMPTDPELQATLLVPVVQTAVCSRAYAAKVESIEGLESFLNLDLIQDGHRLWDEIFEEAGVVPPARMQNFNLANLAMQAAEAGQGVVMIPTLLGHLDVKSGNLVELWRPTKDWRAGFYLVGAITDSPREAVQLFTDWCLTEMRELNAS